MSMQDATNSPQEDEEEEEESPGYESEFLTGESASLEPLRSAISTGNEETAINEILHGKERILLSPTPVLVTLQDQFETIEGHFLITSKRCLFVAQQDASADLSIGAECIHLHAQSADPLSVYIQLTTDDDEADPTEIHILPSNTTTTTTTTRTICESIFSNLSELIALNPIEPDGDNNDTSAMMGMMMMGMMDTTNSNDRPAPSDDMIVAERSTSPHQFSDGEEEEEEDADKNTAEPNAKRHKEEDSDEGATPEERARMLAHLDSILVVRPGLEIQDDEQFADAEEEQEEDGGDVVMTNTTEDATEKSAAAIPIQTRGGGGGQFDDADDEDDALL